MESKNINPDKFIKFDGEKIRMELLDPFFVEGVANILTHGAKKYSNYDIIHEKLTIGELEKCCVPHVIKINNLNELILENVDLVIKNEKDKKKESALIAIKEDMFIQKKCAEPVMIKISKNAIQNMLKDNMRSIKIGQITIKNELQFIKKNGELILYLENEINNLSGIKDYLVLDLHKKNMITYFKKDAEFVNKYQLSILTSTTATKVDNFEEFFVVAATTDLECLETILMELNKHLIIYKNVPFLKLKNSGANNWKKATTEDLERYKGALYRHWNAYMKGEVLDPDSGLPHMYHIGCNAMFLSYFDRRKEEIEQIY